MKKFLVLNQDGIGIIDAPPQDISARVERVAVGAIRTDFYKLVADNGTYDFLVGIFDNKQDAEKNLKSLNTSLKKARRNKFKYDGWQPSNGEVSALELFEEIEESAHHREHLFDVAKEILNVDDEMPFDDCPFFEGEAKL